MATFNVPYTKTWTRLPASSNQNRYRIAPFPRFESRLMLSQFQGGCSRSQSKVFQLRAQLNEIATEKKSNSSPSPSHGTKSTKELETVPDALSISTFITQVSDLVKIVDSRDIVELELKQLGCEIFISKKDPLPQPSVAASYNYAQPPIQQAVHSPQLPPTNTPAPATPALTPPAPAKPKSSHLPFKCPMAGTFYRCPAPGAPPFVKVGDKVQKGQVLCIIEAMKLMNEIEADQSGTVVEVLAEDAKPVSVDTPLFTIEP